MLLRAGTTLVLQMHYTPNGTATTDRTRVGIKFASAPPKEELRLTALLNGTLKIPAGAPDYSLAAEMTTTADVTLRQILPHTHLRGKSWEYTITYPDGRNEVILSVPKYDFNWQTSYIFAEAAQASEGHQAAGGGALRQLDREQFESGSDGRRALGRSDVGGDDVLVGRLLDRRRDPWRRDHGSVEWRRPGALTTPVGRC